PIKINCVIRRGVNDTEILALVRRFRGTGHIVRFIEYMDVGTTNGWKPEDVVPASEILEKISSEFPIEPIDPTLPGEVATRYRFSDGSGEIGVIASITQPFCKECTRARLSADGHLFTCLFASNGTDLRDMVRSGATASQLAQRIASVWKARDDRYSELRDELIEMTARQGQPANLSATPVAVRPPRRRAEMSYLGG
ncbi:MAG: GTP 3',8-cyclase MoaA, partial [Actinobacteria bacterium]|nr:GTP 3',8-cyclase MoaA [Actinomycetota bacterium]